MFRSHNFTNNYTHQYSDTECNSIISNNFDPVKEIKSWEKIKGVTIVSPSSYSVLNYLLQFKLE